MNNNINKLHKKALKALNQKDYQLAHQCLLSILSCDKFFADAYFLLGIIASDHHNVLKGIQLTHQAHMLKPDNSEYIGHLAKLYALDNQSVQAKRTLDKLTRQEIKNALTLDTIGVAYSKIGLHAQAVDYFQQAVKIKPNNENFHFNLAAALKFSGKFPSAKSAYETTIKLKPNHYKAHAALSSLSTISLDNNHLATLTSTFKTLKHSDDKLLIGHAIAREYEALKDYDKSFQALMTAKQDKLSSLTYSLDDDKAMFTSIIAAFENDNLQTKLNDGYQNDEAVFVVGMPRTGTTLVERILSNHQDISTAGELQNFGVLFKQFSQTKSNRVIDPETIRGSEGIDFKALGQSYIESTRVLTGNNKKFVDKMPLNILYAGFIIRALPKVKIICLDRNPLDTVVSNFKQLFSVNQSYYDYSYSLTWTAEFYLLFHQLMKFWQQKFPDNFYVVNYEALVNQPEVEAKKLVEFTGVPWQKDCLDIDKNENPVATASAVQVRQPITNKSINSWKRFDAYLDEVKLILNYS